MSHFAAINLGCIRGGRPLFAGLDFELRAGQALVLTGPNGSGKSSLLRLLAGLARPAAGEIRWEGAALAEDADAHAGRLHYVGHLDAVKPLMTVAENLAFWARLRGGRHLEEALIHFGLDALAETPGRRLSAGQKRRLALARLIAAPQELWLLDEPTTGLDDEAVARFGNALADHLSGGGIAVLATHQELPVEAPERLDIRDFPPNALDREYLW
jgi:heme exporter protein A